MRTTLTLDADVADRLQRVVRRSGKSLKGVVNEALRTGLGLTEKPVEPSQFRTGEKFDVAGPRAKDLLDLLSAEMGLQVIVDSNGLVQREAGPPAPQEAALVNAFDEAAAPLTPQFTITAIDTAPSRVYIDDFETQRVSVGQLSSIPSRPPLSMSDAPTRGELLAHVLEEYAKASQWGGFTGMNFFSAHAAGLGAQNAGGGQ